METAYYTLRAREISTGEAQAIGGDSRQIAFLRQSAPRQIPHKENNILSLEEYRVRAAEEDETREDPGGGEPYPRTPRTDHSRDGLHFLLELAATLAIVAVAVAACIAFLR